MNFALQAVPLPLRIRPATPMSDRQLLEFCAANDVLRVEREPNGEILVMTPAGGRTGKKNTDVILELAYWARANSRGVAFDCNTGFLLADGSMRSPDAAWVERSRWDALTEDEQEGYPPLCPDFVIELRSPSDRLNELEAKMQQWIANGARLAWLIDPVRTSVTIYRPSVVAELLERPATVHGDGPVAGFVLEMARIWA
jgi:Uma2 family endonuclease